MMLHANTFSHHFIQIADHSEAGNANLLAYANATNPVVSDESSRLRALLNDKDGIILIANGSEVIIIHSVVNLGGTLRRPKDKIVGLQGLGSNALPILIEPKSFIKGLSLSVPRDKTFLECSDVATLERIRAYRMVEKIDCTPAFIPAPFEMKAILEAETKDPLQLLLILKDAGTAFDNQNGATELMIHDSNPVSGSRIRQWLWAVGNGRMPAAVFWSDGDDGELREFSMRRHTECILPPIPASNTTVPVSIADDPVKIAHEVKRAEEKEEEKEDRTKDWIPHLIKRMILNASSADGQRAASEFNSEFLNFFNAESAGAAGVYLYRYLRDNGLDDSVIDERAVLSMYYGDFISFNPNVFKDFCVFSFQEGSGLSPNQFEKFLMLHLSDGLVNIEQMNQTITVPKDYNKMVESAKRYNCAQRLLFTKESLIFKSYKKFVREFEGNKSTIKDMIEEDPDICAKILYLAQTEIKLWSKRCMKCEDRKDVDDSYIDFKDIVRGIKTGCIVFSRLA